MVKDTLHTIRRSFRHFFSGTLLSRLTGMLRDMSMAYAFGTKPSIGAFMVAFRLAHLLRRIFGEGALQSAFIPQFEELRLQEEKSAFSFFCNLYAMLTLFLLLFILISGSLLAALLWGGNFQSDNQEILFLTLLMLPSLLFICLFGLNISLLQCQKSYFTSSVAPAAFNIIWILSVFILRKMPTHEAMQRLSLGIILACFCQWLFTAIPLWKYVKGSFTSSLFTFSPDLRKFIKPLFLGILGIASSQINNAVDTLFAHIAEPQGPALLWYAIRIQQLPLALFGIAIAGAILPPLSRALKAGLLEKYQQFLSNALYQSFCFMLPVTAMIFMLGDTSVHFLYGRGDFGAQSVIDTTYCLWGYAIGLIPSTFVLVLAPSHYAQNNYNFPALVSFLSMLSNVLLNSLFIFGFGWGAISIAVATSLSAWMNFFLLSWNLSQKGVSLSFFLLLKKTIPISSATLGAIFATYQIRMHPFFSMSFFQFPSSFFEQIIALMTQFLFFAAAFFLCFSPFFLLKRCAIAKNLQFFNNNY